VIAIVDYGRGNVFSLGQALRQVGAEFELTSDPAKVRAAAKLILPGVGAFADCVRNLRERGLAEPVIAAARLGSPLLGICVGCQVLLDQGEEFGVHAGLGLIQGVVRRLPEPRDDDAEAIRIPNVGWRTLSVARGSSLFSGLPPESMMYFVHSYAPEPASPDDVSASIVVNGQRAAAAVERGRVFGVQFHPEKSGPAGLALLAAFAREG
jgi:glutamine amidotransferase